MMHSRGAATHVSCTVPTQVHHCEVCFTNIPIFLSLVHRLVTGYPPYHARALQWVRHYHPPIRHQSSLSLCTLLTLMPQVALGASPECHTQRTQWQGWMCTAAIHHPSKSYLNSSIFSFLAFISLPLQRSPFIPVAMHARSDEEARTTHTTHQLAFVLPFPRYVETTTIQSPLKKRGRMKQNGNRTH